MDIKALYDLYTAHYMVDTDTRHIRKNTLFFALKGDNFNGNTFAKEALKKGAAFAIVDEEKYAKTPNIILVNDALETLQNLAKYHRQQLTIPIIGLTGSNGKTTTKELINCVLSKKYHTCATKGNLNNHIGVPLTILSITPKTEIGIIEMGANHQKEIAFLSNIAMPDYGYITNFGKAHLEGFGGIEGVIKGKSELYTNLKENDKTAVINPKDPIQIAKTKDIKQIILDKNCTFKSANPLVELQLKNTNIKSNLIGAYNYNNIACAITFGTIFNIKLEDIKEAIEGYLPTNNRSQIINKNTNEIILDAYNANPSSMSVAIKAFSELQKTSKIVVLGDMFELGDDSKKEHQAIAELADSLKFTSVYYVGSHFYGINTHNKKFKDFKSLDVFIKELNIQNSTIFIKRALEVCS
jgi:UDP-N-acetylmuramoyl-tripeptide--D-alanyl-D-alanine ligase